MRERKLKILELGREMEGGTADLTNQLECTISFLVLELNLEVEINFFINVLLMYSSIGFQFPLQERLCSRYSTNLMVLLDDIWTFP
jgi:hypothetical protein